MIRSIDDYRRVDILKLMDLLMKEVMIKTKKKMNDRGYKAGSSLVSFMNLDVPALQRLVS